MKATTMPRLTVPKAYKMFIGGAFVRGDSGRYVQVKGASVEGNADAAVVNVPVASRKDVRDAVVAARGAFEPWARRTAYNRGQILYRLAEVMESRAPELVVALRRAGLSAAEATREVEVAVDRAVFYAGFTDKLGALLGSTNAVSGPFLAFSATEPTGVVGVVADSPSILLGIVSLVLPVLAGGNTALAVVPAVDPRVAVLFAECIATSDVPAGVVNVLFGDAAALGLEIAKHRDVNAVVAHLPDEASRAAIARAGAESVKRIVVRAPLEAAELFHVRGGQGLGFIEPFLETKSFWHPVGV